MSENVQSSGREWPAWHEELVSYRTASTWRGCWQLLSTTVPYLGLWALMLRAVQSGSPGYLTLGLAVIASAFLVRLFILFHDCVHGSLFPQKGANTWVGTVLGLLVFTSIADCRLAI
jgi:acyl-lipid omega-6 desaturase (Delta-12 desaturase)